VQLASFAPMRPITGVPLDPSKPTVLTMYNPFPMPGVPFPQQCTAARMQLFGMSYAYIEKAVREQFTKMFGEAGFDADRDIAGIISNRWGHAYVVDPPYSELSGARAGEQALEIAQ
jgi:spermidine dehydrogenase